MTAQINPRMNGMPLRDLSGSFDYASNPAYEEMLGTSIVLTRAHIPFRVARAGDSLEGLKALMINQAMVMSDDEVERVRAFVRGGGTLLATGLTSLYRPDGTSRGDFGLSDVFGVSFTGAQSREINYLTFNETGERVSCNRPAALVQSRTAAVLAGLEEPLFDPAEEKYASIHSNPPGRSTGRAGLTVQDFGLGRCLYLAAPLLAIQQDAQQEFGERLLRARLPLQVLDSDAPPCVELTLLRTNGGGLVLGLVNYQKELPNVPVSSLSVRLRWPGVPPRRCRRVSDGQEQTCEWAGGVLTLRLHNLETLEMVVIL
jgi:hypothetical protein